MAFNSHYKLTPDSHLGVTDPHLHLHSLTCQLPQIYLNLISGLTTSLTKRRRCLWGRYRSLVSALCQQQGTRNQRWVKGERKSESPTWVWQQVRGKIDRFRQNIKKGWSHQVVLKALLWAQVQLPHLKEGTKVREELSLLSGVQWKDKRRKRWNAVILI